tara:strand:- start:48065 stop:48682 length:618 start_codon:yes stop_codon:yes gene_type:complete
MLKEKFIQLIGSYSEDEMYNLDCWKEIEKKYSSKSRYYHNLEHLENMLKEVEEVNTQIVNLDCFNFALYYHDIIYSATKSDNEFQSSLRFQKRISKTSFPNIQECMRTIEATKYHKRSEDHDTNILLDCDLSILGKCTIEYMRYAENIRKEYQIYPDFLYRKGRKKVLESLLALTSIYKTDFFIQKYEKQARENLELELDQLAAQ